MSEPRRRLLPNCEEIHHLTMKGMDRPLTWGERLRLRGHLAICATCTHFSGQMRMMREAMWRLGQDGGDGPGPRP
ncbi:Putative zinc-finger [Cupriavidus sp. OV038]|uniref:zf-HC2 domain-containing protein n=1 Tax=unclassified Cupriavidus TaxID=2640874 RepID=UPI0008E92D39|nr:MULTISPECIES: zf-HC2 domain-containing protein [unclassified Cupriavidus]SFC73103.1 Putative zinc-finger [Cupriavidus sp. OV038]SFO75399.1 Putative zinc-finger [Cupriavidus sp. OV096]